MDIGSSSVARSVVGLVLGYVTSVVVDLAFLIEVCLYRHPLFVCLYVCLLLLVFASSSNLLIILNLSEFLVPFCFQSAITHFI